LEIAKEVIAKKKERSYKNIAKIAKKNLNLKKNPLVLIKKS